MKLGGWGRYPLLEAAVSAPRDEAALAAQLARGPAIARGNGRAYGDSAVSPQNTLHMRHFDRLLAFDEASGRLEAEAGVLLADVVAVFLPRGWFPAVTPGTKFVTLGGMIAADVHGKNHHRDGSLGRFVDWIDVMDAEGRVRRCSRGCNAELFAWTLGGMGLTGIVLRAGLRLRRVETGWIRVTTLPAPDLEAAMAAFEAAGEAAYSVAWIDCLAGGERLGRALVMLGEHAGPEELGPRQRRDRFALGRRRRLTVPLDAPSCLLSGPAVRAFNRLYYRRGARRTAPQLVGWDSYFYPLDSLVGWNRLYGRRGLLQFQCVLPLATAAAGLRALLGATAQAGRGSFLAVLKRFGAQPGRISFPMPGYSLAMDFPVSGGSLTLMRELDRIAVAHGGRFYLAKDARMTAETLAASDGRMAALAQMRRESGLHPAFQSAQSRRLSL